MFRKFQVNKWLYFTEWTKKEATLLKIGEKFSFCLNYPKLMQRKPEAKINSYFGIGSILFWALIETPVLVIYNSMRINLPGTVFQMEM